MTAPQHEESVLVETILGELFDISAKLSPGSSESNSLLQIYKDKVERICTHVNQEKDQSLPDYLIILIDGLEQLAQIDRNLSGNEYRFLLKIPNLLSDYLLLPSYPQDGETLLDLLRDPDWIRPISAEEEHVIIQLPESDEDTQYNDGLELDDILKNFSDDPESDLSGKFADTDVVDIADHSPYETNEESSDISSDIDTSQQELVNLIKAELEEIIDNQYSPEYDLNTHNQQSCVYLLKNFSDQVENISNALNLIGLEGVSQCGKFISSNMISFSEALGSLNKNHAFLLKQWPVKFLDYLNNYNDSNSIAGLLTLLTNESWYIPLDPSEFERLKLLLENPVFKDEEKEKRQSKATAEDVDLSLPDDVNQELLDGLLQDLPAQTEEFSISIQNISEGGGIDNIDTAQRVAHTLKGAANVVGVKGIANLTHHLEDILEAQSKAKTLPDKALTNVLIRASDCLESMTETLLGIDTLPDDAVDVLQDVLNWANLLDGNTTVDTEDSNEEPSPSEHDNQPPPDSIDHTENSDENTDIKRSNNNTPTENVLRIPVSLADDMLRLAGENLIYTSQIQENINILSRKQDAMDLHNQSLVQLSYDLEHLIDIQGFMPGSNMDNSDEIFDALEMDEYHEIHTISRRLVEIAADSVELSHELDKDLSGLKELVVNQDHLHKEGEELVLRTRMVPIRTIIPRLKRGVRQASRLTGKQVELFVNDNHTYMDSEVLNSMIEPLMHILRNSVDHGIESEDERLAKGKSPGGKIDLNFSRKGNQIIIDINDDGRGLNTEEIYFKAVSEGLVSSDEDLSKEYIQKLILEPGFTTRSNVTQVSGRGIGLDVVSVKIRDLKGSIDINSNINEGCRISLSLPISSFSTHSLLVRVRQYIYAISSHGIEEILYPGIGEVRQIGDETIYKLDHEAYNAILIDTLLDLPPDTRKIERNVRPILLVKSESGTKTAILIQDVIDSRDVVVKNMGSYIPKLNGIIGATVLGDGSVSPVIDLPEMLHSYNTQRDGITETLQKTTPGTQSRKLPNILVVDDSLSSRRSLAQFVEDMGLNVRTARDGLDALNIIESNRPDLLIVDMEMPKMNGLELTSHVRATPNIRNLPIIMITSRSTDKHKKTAIEKGVNHYMVKPFNEDELAKHINTMTETL